MLPNIYPKTSAFIPFASDIKIIPKAKELADIKAIAASPCILFFSLNFSSKTDAKITTGIETKIGVQFMTTAIDRAEKPTCERPSPIIEYRFKTKLTPKIAQQKETKIPTISALNMKGYCSVSLTKSNNFRLLPKSVYMQNSHDIFLLF